MAGRDRGFGAHQVDSAVNATVHSYAARMAEYATLSALEVYYAHVDVAAILAFVDKRARPYLKTTVKSAAHHDALHELPKLTEIKDGKRRIIDRPPIIFHPDWGYPDLPEAALASYRQTILEDRRDLLDRFEFVDAAMKVVGVGSVGLGAVVALLLEIGTGNPLFLQVKEAEASVLERFLGASEFEQHGERVVAGQRRLQAASDVFLGWTVGPLGHHIYVRQLQDEKGGAVIEAMTHADLTAWGELCGWALARGHARTGEPAAIAAYLGPPDDPAIATTFVRYANAYADQNERDFETFQAAIKAGRLAAEPGV